MIRVAVRYSAPSIIFLTSKWRVALMRVSKFSPPWKPQWGAGHNQNHHRRRRAVAPLQHRLRGVETLTEIKVRWPVHWRLSSTPSDPVSGGRHVPGSIAHSAPRGLLLAMCLPGGALNPRHPGHSLQCVGPRRGHSVFLGAFPVRFAWRCGLLDKQRKESSLSFEYLTENTRDESGRNVSAHIWAHGLHTCGFLMFFVTHSGPWIIFLFFIFSLSCSKPASAKALCSWLPLPTACCTWTSASSQLWSYSRWRTHINLIEKISFRIISFHC